MRKLASLVFLVLAACGGGGGSVALEDFADKLADASCELLVKCGEARDVAACRAANTGLDTHLSASLGAAVKAGRAKFDGGAAQDCLDALGARSCDVTSQSNRELPASCRTTAGTLHDTEACAVDAECISQVCDVPACGLACCIGACVGDDPPTLGQAGDSCEAGSCDAGAYCDDVDTTCVALKPSGAACQRSIECGYGLDCLFPDGRCGSLPQLGESCTGACRDAGTTCSAASRICVKVGLEGAACSSTADCSQLYVCNSSKQCSAGIALGDPCTASQRCADPGAFCDVPLDAAMGTCVAPKPEDAPCQFDEQCASDVCDPASHACVADVPCL